MLKQGNRKLVLASGDEFYGDAFGPLEEKIVEVVFNTSLVGYQEILSDPSYTDQGVVMTYPLIGNYGLAEDDYETAVPTIGALIVREYNPLPSNFRAAHSLGEIMEKYSIPGISGIDTRRLARTIRNQGSQPALITDAACSHERAVELLSAFVRPRDAVSRVSTKGVRICTPKEKRFRVVAIDCGMKENIVRSLVGIGCEVVIVPYNTNVETILSYEPDGVFLSNGPGDPTDVPEVIETVRSLIGRLPIFGICLGHQIISLAYGARTYKLKFGHRGGNHPVRHLATGKIEITSQNHSYAVDRDSLSSTPLTVTHENILDGTVEGLSCERDGVFSVQYHPESAPGPQDSFYLFEQFIRRMEGGKCNAETH